MNSFTVFAADNGFIVQQDYSHNNKQTVVIEGNAPSDRATIEKRFQAWLADQTL